MLNSIGYYLVATCPLSFRKEAINVRAGYDFVKYQFPDRMLMYCEKLCFKESS